MEEVSLLLLRYPSGILHHLDPSSQHEWFTGKALNCLQYAKCRLMDEVFDRDSLGLAISTEVVINYFSEQLNLLDTVCNTIA